MAGLGGGLLRAALEAVQWSVLLLRGETNEASSWALPEVVAALTGRETEATRRDLDALSHFTKISLRSLKALRAFLCGLASLVPCEIEAEQQFLLQDTRRRRHAQAQGEAEGESDEAAAKRKTPSSEFNAAHVAVCLDGTRDAEFWRVR